jgi:hypothetical protein
MVVGVQPAPTPIAGLQLWDPPRYRAPLAAQHTVTVTVNVTRTVADDARCTVRARLLDQDDAEVGNAQCYEVRSPYGLKVPVVVMASV